MRQEVRERVEQEGGNGLGGKLNRDLVRLACLSRAWY